MKSTLAALFLSAVLILPGWSVASAADPAGAPRIVKIRAGVDNAMKFDVASIAVAPGETIKVVLTNASTLPKDVMGHNWVLLKARTDPVAFANAAAPEAGNGYIPSKQRDKVLAVVGLLGPNETGEVTFTAPTAPGDYPFLCTFPAHCLIGMKG